MSKLINSFDIDGVIYMGKFEGVYPGPYDVIITGRSFEEKHETMEMLRSKKIRNEVYFNNVTFEQKTRKSSGIHKGNTLKRLLELGYNIGIHFEDDPIQAEEIKKIVPNINIVLLQHDLIEKENVRNTEWGVI
jgi:hypothetical protein